VDQEAGTTTVGAPPAGAAPDARATGAARRIPAEEWRAWGEARRLAEEALEEARRIRDGAAREVEAARCVARDAGREEGLARAALHLVRAAAERDRMLAGCAGELARLAAAMATRILGREVQPGADAIAAASRALEEVRGARRAAIRVSPADVDALRSEGALRGLVATLRLRVDASLGTGEVVVEAEGATIDGRFAAQLETLRRVAEEGSA
jgi:flagellar biosynthesis/type III secretory pathway protein FliH